MKMVVHRAQDGWRWRAEAANGEIVSESGDAYENKSYAMERRHGGSALLMLRSRSRSNGQRSIRPTLFPSSGFTLQDVAQHAPLMNDGRFHSLCNWAPQPDHAAYY